MAKQVQHYETQPFPERDMIDKLLTSRHVHLTPQIEITSMTIMLNLVETGHWIAVMSETLIQGQGKLRAIPIAGKKTQMHPAVIVLKDSYQKVSAKEFMRILLESQNHKGTSINYPFLYFF